jgi:Relaxase/Mobilisation nuclease domain
MIIKGGSRAAPGQLAWHLQRRDTNEKVEILEIQFPTSNLAEAFRDWQTISEGTRGFKGLYHANIDPAMDYTMTREQWQHAVDVLEKELKLEGQPRAVIMHEKLGREHLHVVWARTDIDTMTLCSDSQNYMAHERASQRLENEFGHEPVPGKHAKRDREQQPEFPRAEANQAEWQQGERTGIDPATRKEQITTLRQASDNAQAFKVALEEQGYILANGRRGFVIVDQTGSIHSLGRQVQDIKPAQFREFMKPIDREALPTAEEAKDLQQERQQQARHQEPAQQQPDQQQAQKAEPSPPPEQQQPEHSHQQEPSQYDYIDHEEQLRRQHQAPEPPQPPDESQERPLKSRRPETPRHYPYQPDIDGLGAIIEVAVTPLTEALRAILEYQSAKKGELPHDEARRRKEAASAQTPRQYPKQPDIDGLGAIIEVAVTPLTEALRAILDYRSAKKGELPDDEVRRRKEPESSPAEPPPEPPAGSSSEPPPQQTEQQEPKEEEPRQQPEDKPADKPSEPAPDPNQARNEALRKALAERQAEEGRKLVESQRAEMDQLRQSLDRETREKLDRFDALHHEETEALRQEQKEASAGFMDSVKDLFNPARAAERKAERQRELQQLAARLKQQRDDYVALLQETNALEIHNREELHALRLHDLEVKGAEERDRYLREQELARKLQEENEERERQLALQRARDGPKRTQ